MLANFHPRSSSPAPQFELKAGTFTLPLLRLFSTDLDVVAVQLAEKVTQAQGFFHNAPVVIDLRELGGEALEFSRLVALMRGYGMIPVGVRGGTRAQNMAAEALALAVLADSRPARAEVEESPAPNPAPSATLADAMLVTHPVRSGQRIYAEGRDLVVLGAVSSGAEVMADGHIHVYAPLRGRALAGVQGHTAARIFCIEWHAELVSVAGHYRTSENIDPKLYGQAAQVFLEERILRIVGL